ncbi:MAG: OmpA family protein [Sphingobacteriales bacterium]|nr:OmpA family protein [Sphingobacteriales bacterium]MBK6891402.1 OmpA family protein [Sphingobacteriales bacterium]MBL0248620.1 OmpA family protein [Sphingobacteriales bacterium]
MLSKNYLLFALLLLFAGVMPLMAQDDAQPDAAKSEESSDTSATGEGKKCEYPYPEVRTEEYRDFVPQKRHDQQDKFMDRKYNYPARPRNMWEVGLSVGPLLVSGDIKTGLGKMSASGNFSPKLGFGLHVRKAFGYIFSLRASYMMGTTWGRNWQPTRGWAESSINTDPYFIPNRSLVGSEDNTGSVYTRFEDDGTKVPDYTMALPNGQKYGKTIFYNYKTKIRELGLSGIVNIHNIRFHKRQTCISLYGLVGIGGTAYRTFQDMLGEDGNEYNFDPLVAQYTDLVNEARANEDFDFSVRKEMMSAIDETLDGKFESQAERHWDDFTPFKKYSFKPTAHVGTGIAFRLGRRVNLGLETRVSYTNDDLLDGQRWEEWGALTRDYDTYVYTGVNANFNIGSKNSVEPLWWMNPLDYSYQELNEAPCCEDLPPPPDLSDDDNDGVPNLFDVEPDSREGCPVDTKGRMLDSDRDGVLDCDDKEPHTRYNMIDKVDKYGVAPGMTCKDLEGNICDCVKACTPPPAPKTCCDRVMPNVLFDSNRYGVKPEFEAQLAMIAGMINSSECSNDRWAVVGNTDVREGSNNYGNKLSYNRAQEVINILTTKYGVPRHKLTLKYQAATMPVIGGLSATSARKGLDAEHALNRRVEIRCVYGGESDMAMPAGPKNAGRR